jgi:hypothetical protein
MKVFVRDYNEVGRGLQLALVIVGKPFPIFSNVVSKVPTQPKA